VRSQGETALDAVRKAKSHPTTTKQKTATMMLLLNHEL
jgi:hypothetical protein